MIIGSVKRKYLEKICHCYFFLHMNRPKIESGPLLGLGNVGHNQHCKHIEYYELSGK
jgi:hypothetical protein